VHFELLVRSDPPLKLARLRASQQVLEVRAAQLRFTQDETRELMGRIMGDLATDETIALFSERTEGWAAGIHLAATSMRDSSNAAGFALGFARSGSQPIVEYLVSEVLERLEEPERTLLLCTSVLPRFCAPLCDAVLAQVGQGSAGAAFLDRVRSMNLFLVALDEDGTWFRFHHLLADILSHRLRLTLNEATIARLHSAASRWFEANGLIDEAVTHSLSAHDAVHAARLVEVYADDLLNSENWRSLERWIALLPVEQTKRPALLVARGWVEQFRFRPTSIFTLAQQAEDGLACDAGEYSPTKANTIRGEISALRALASMHTNQWEQCLHFGVAALAAIPSQSAYIRGVTEFAVLRAVARLGRPDAAIDRAQLWLSEQGSKPDSRSLRMLLALCGVHYDLLDLGELSATTASYLLLAQQAKRPVSVAWASWLLGFIHYQRNELSAAESYFASVVQHPDWAHTRTVIDSWTGLTLCLRAQGKHVEASRQAGELRSHLLQGGLVELTPVADALAAYLEILAGRPVRLSDSYAEDLPRQLGLDLQVLPFQVWALAGIHSGLRSQQAKLAAKLTEYHAHLATHPVPRRLLELLLIEALLHAVQDEPKAALDAVRRAVAVAEPGGSLRFFVDMGSALKPYLYDLADQGVAPEFIARLLAAYTPEESMAVALEKPVALLTANSSAILGPDILSNRELDVLLLLERRLSNKEIAQILVISPRTVKRHTISIYGKLQVNSRRSAVARAKMLGLMPSH